MLNALSEVFLLPTHEIKELTVHLLPNISLTGAFSLVENGLSNVCQYGSLCVLSFANSQNCCELCLI